MDSWPLIVAALSGILFLYFYHQKKMNYFKDLGIPYLSPWPIVGNMGPFIFQTKHISVLLQELYNLNKEAKYVGFYDFMSPLLVVRDPELIKQIAVKNFDNFPDHPNFVNETQDPFFGKNLSALTGDRWRNVRNLLSPAFTSSKMKMMFNLIIKCAQDFTDHLETLTKENQNYETDIKDIFRRYTNDVIATSAFGITVDSMKDPKNEFFERGKEATTLEGFVMTLKFFMIRDFPKLTSWFGIKILSDRVTTFFMNLVSNIIKTRDEKGIIRPDMLQLMMDARGDANNKVELDIQEMTAQAFIFFFGGFETTSTTMSFLAHELAMNPQIQENLHNEILEVMDACKGKPTYDAINNMPYLDAVISETLRLYPQLDFLDRVCVKAFELPPALPGLNPIVVKPGTTIWFPAAGIHDDPQYYENPKIFDPDRFVRKKVSLNQTTFLGFGLGPRMCIGIRFALLETKILFFHLLAKCLIKPSSKTVHPLVLDVKKLTKAVKGGFSLKLEPRNPASNNQ